MIKPQRPSENELRSFGVLVGSVFGVIGVWPLLFWGGDVRVWGIALGGALILLGGLSPRVLAPVHKVWMQIGYILGWINTRVLLGLVFYGLITPMGLVFRLMGKDVMRQTMTQDSSTYRVLRKPRLKGHMKYQF
jgi:hypothetical protein